MNRLALDKVSTIDCGIKMYMPDPIQKSVLEGSTFFFFSPPTEPITLLISIYFFININMHVTSKTFVAQDAFFFFFVLQLLFHLKIAYNYYMI